MEYINNTVSLDFEYEIESRIKKPALTFSKSTDLYYVYRHYYIREDGKEITFYVGKGTGLRASNTNNRSSLWKERVKKLNGNYYIDIIDFFTLEEDALKFEKEVTSYYTASEFGCECNKINKTEKASMFLQKSNLKAIEALMSSNESLSTILKTYLSMYDKLIGESIISLVKSLRLFLESNNSDFKITYKISNVEKFGFNDINSYSYIDTSDKNFAEKLAMCDEKIL